MPELPEVETVARQLAPVLQGRRALGLRRLDPLLRVDAAPRLRGRTLEEVRRSGKQVVFRFSTVERDSRPVWGVIHLRMTGRLIWVGAGERRPARHLRAMLALEGGRLLFYDARRFGTWGWHRSETGFAPAGVDPLDSRLDLNRFVALLGGSRQELKAWLLRQDRLVGLGNIYASEILHRARLSPFRPAGSLSRGEAGDLLRATRRILRRAIDACGTTFSDFQDSRGLTGTYARYLTVYDRGGEPCRRCGSAVRRVVQHQRSTYYCASCQG